MLDYYAHIARKRTVTSLDVERLMNYEISDRELNELRILPRVDLLSLMKFCDIRTYEDTPVIACTEDELRLAYIIWRSQGIKKRKKKIVQLNRQLKKVQRMLERYIKITEAMG